MGGLNSVGQQNLLSAFFHFILFYWAEVFILCKENKKGEKRHKVCHCTALCKTRKQQTPLFFFALGQSAPLSEDVMNVALPALKCFQ